MTLFGLHYEDIKASIRKKWGSLNAFERAHELPRGGVKDWAQGKMSRRVQDAIERHLRSLMAPSLSIDVEPSSDGADAHRLNRKAA